MAKKWLSEELKTWSGRLNRCADSAYTPPIPPVSIQEKRVIPWVKADGDRTLRLDYQLNAASVVFDLGGYEGDWAAEIYCKYGSKVYVFEPVAEFYKNITNRFSANKDVQIFCFGLSSENKKDTLSFEENESSAYRDSDTKVPILLKDVKEFLDTNKIRQIDLMKINIEGGEFDLLERLIEIGFIGSITNLQIQFHDFAPDAKRRVAKIREKFSATHRLTYQYPWVWENWQLKNRK